MANPGKIVAVYSVVCDGEVWRQINNASLSGNFNLELARLGFIVTGGPSGVSNSIVYSFQQYGHLSIDNVYEIVTHVWGESNHSINNDDVSRAFIRAWNATLFDGSAYRATPFPGTPSRVEPFSLTVTMTDVSAEGGLAYINDGRIFLYPDYSEIRGDVQNFAGLPPMNLSNSWFDRVTTSRILTSNQPNFIGRNPTSANISETIRSIASGAREELAPIVNEAGQAIADSAENAANQVIQRLPTSPFSSNETQLFTNMLIVFGILGAGSYAIGKVSEK